MNAAEIADEHVTLGIGSEGGRAEQRKPNAPSHNDVHDPSLVDAQGHIGA